MIPGEAAHVRKAGGWVIVSFENSLEDDDWDDGTGWMGSPMSLRSELLRGDIRCLYLGWLLCAQNEEFAEDELEPAVPAGLGELSAPLHSLIEFLGIDENLVEVAATVSAPLNAGPDREELATWIQSLPEKEKNNLLVAAVSGTGERWKQSRDLIEALRPKYHDRLDENFRHPDSFQLNGYSLGEFKSFYIALLVLCSIHEYICYPFDKPGHPIPVSSLVMVKSRPVWTSIWVGMVPGGGVEPPRY
jgi:hypothetical protein